MSKKNIFVALFGVFFGISGCHVQEAVAPNEQPVVSQGLRVFERGDLFLQNNKFFLWKQGMSDGDVTTVTQSGWEIDLLDDQAKTIRLQTRKLEGSIFDLEEQTLKSVKQGIKDAKKRLKLAKDEKKAEESKPGAERDLLKLAKLKEEITGLEMEIPQKEAEKQKHEGSLKALQDQKAQIEVELPEIERRSTEAISRLDASVEWFPLQPSLVAFTFEKTCVNEDLNREVVRDGEAYMACPTGSKTKEYKKDGAITAVIRRWNIGDGTGPQDYTSNLDETPTRIIEDMRYRENGGVITFKAVAYQDSTRQVALETFCFKIVRNRYGATQRFNRIYFVGDLYWEHGASACDLDRVKKSQTMRKGVAKLVDTNN